VEEFSALNNMKPSTFQSVAPITGALDPGGPREIIGRITSIATGGSDITVGVMQVSRVFQRVTMCFKVWPFATHITASLIR
jgi:hypothetical protein